MKQSSNRGLNQRGFSLIQVLLVVALLSAVVLAISQLNLQLQKNRVQSAAIVQLSLFQRNLITLINSKASWLETIGRNPSMSCLQNHSNCLTGGAPISNQIFSIYDGSNSPLPYFDSISPTSGLNVMAVPCTGYPTGGDKCPFRFELRWSALCIAPNCVDPQVKVWADLVFNSAVQAFPFNPVTYSVPVIFRSFQ